MKYKLIITFFLAALSVGAGIGLSALHQSSVPTQVSVLSTLQIDTSENGFVIPTYVPDILKFTAVLAALKSPDLDIGIISNDPAPTIGLVIDVVPEKDIEAVSVTPSKEPIVTPGAVLAAQPAQVRTKTQASVVARSAQPVVVQDRTTTNRLKYIVGVYR